MIYPSMGVVRVSNKFTDFNSDNLCEVYYGSLQGIPEPQDKARYIVSSIVLEAAKSLGRTDCVAPATGHPDCIRKDGFVISVPGFICQEHINLI